MKLFILFCMIFSFAWAGGVNVFDRFDFLNLSIAPYVQALGETGVVNAKGAESVYFNPALGVKQMPHSLLMGSSIPGYDQQVFYAYYHIPAWYRGSTFYVGLVSYQISGVELRRHPSDAPDSIMNATQTLLSGGISRLLLSDLSFGINANIVIDNFTTDGMSFLSGAGLAWFPTDEILIGCYGKYLGKGQVLSSVGGQWRVVPECRLSSQIDFGVSEDYFGAQFKCGVDYQLSDTTSVQLGYHSDMFSMGLRQTFDVVGFQLSYTDTPLGARYSFGVELL